MHRRLCLGGLASLALPGVACARPEHQGISGGTRPDAFGEIVRREVTRWPAVVPEEP